MFAFQAYDGTLPQIEPLLVSWALHHFQRLSTQRSLAQLPLVQQEVLLRWADILHYLTPWAAGAILERVELILHSTVIVDRNSLNNVPLIVNGISKIRLEPLTPAISGNLEALVTKLFAFAAFTFSISTSHAALTEAWLELITNFLIQKHVTHLITTVVPTAAGEVALQLVPSSPLYAPRQAFFNQLINDFKSHKRLQTLRGELRDYHPIFSLKKPIASLSSQTFHRQLVMHGACTGAPSLRTTTSLFKEFDAALAASSSASEVAIHASQVMTSGSPIGLSRWVLRPQGLSPAYQASIAMHTDLSIGDVVSTFFKKPSHMCPVLITTAYHAPRLLEQLALQEHKYSPKSALVALSAVFLLVSNYFDGMKVRMNTSPNSFDIQKALMELLYVLDRVVHRFYVQSSTKQADATRSSKSRTTEKGQSSDTKSKTAPLEDDDDEEDEDDSIAKNSSNNRHSIHNGILTSPSKGNTTKSKHKSSPAPASKRQQSSTPSKHGTQNTINNNNVSSTASNRVSPSPIQSLDRTFNLASGSYPSPGAPSISPTSSLSTSQGLNGTGSSRHSRQGSNFTISEVGDSQKSRKSPKMRAVLQMVRLLIDTLYRASSSCFMAPYQCWLVRETQSEFRQLLLFSARKDRQTRVIVLSSLFDAISSPVTYGSLKAPSNLPFESQRSTIKEMPMAFLYQWFCDIAVCGKDMALDVSMLGKMELVGTLSLASPTASLRVSGLSLLHHMRLAETDKITLHSILDSKTPKLLNLALQRIQRTEPELFQSLAELSSIELWELFKSEHGLWWYFLAELCKAYSAEDHLLNCATTLSSSNFDALNIIMTLFENCVGDGAGLSISNNHSYTVGASSSGSGDAGGQEGIFGGVGAASAGARVDDSLYHLGGANGLVCIPSYLILLFTLPHARQTDFVRHVLASPHFHLALNSPWAKYAIFAVQSAPYHSLPAVVEYAMNLINPPYAQSPPMTTSSSSQHHTSHHTGDVGSGANSIAGGTSGINPYHILVAVAMLAELIHSHLSQFESFTSTQRTDTTDPKQILYKKHQRLIDQLSSLLTLSMTFLSSEEGVLSSLSLTLRTFCFDQVVQFMTVLALVQAITYNVSKADTEDLVQDILGAKLIWLSKADKLATCQFLLVELFNHNVACCTLLASEPISGHTLASAMSGASMGSASNLSNHHNKSRTTLRNMSSGASQPKVGTGEHERMTSSSSADSAHSRHHHHHHSAIISPNATLKDAATAQGGSNSGSIFSTPQKGARTDAYAPGLSHSPSMKATPGKSGGIQSKHWSAAPMGGQNSNTTSSSIPGSSPYYSLAPPPTHHLHYGASASSSSAASNVTSPSKRKSSKTRHPQLASPLSASVFEVLARPLNIGLEELSAHTLVAWESLAQVGVLNELDLAPLFASSSSPTIMRSRFSHHQSSGASRSVSGSSMSRDRVFSGNSNSFDLASDMQNQFTPRGTHVRPKDKSSQQATFLANTSVSNSVAMLRLLDLDKLRFSILKWLLHYQRRDFRVTYEALFNAMLQTTSHRKNFVYALASQCVELPESLSQPHAVKAPAIHTASAYPDLLMATYISRPSSASIAPSSHLASFPRISNRVFSLPLHLQLLFPCVLLADSDRITRRIARDMLRAVVMAQDNKTLPSSLRSEAGTNLISELEGGALATAGEIAEMFSEVVPQMLCDCLEKIALSSPLEQSWLAHLAIAFGIHVAPLTMRTLQALYDATQSIDSRLDAELGRVWGSLVHTVRPTWREDLKLVVHFLIHNASSARSTISKILLSIYEVSDEHALRITSILLGVLESKSICPQSPLKRGMGETERGNTGSNLNDNGAKYKTPRTAGDATDGFSSDQNLNSNFSAHHTTASLDTQQTIEALVTILDSNSERLYRTAPRLLLYCLINFRDSSFTSLLATILERASLSQDIPVPVRLDMCHVAALVRANCLAVAAARAAPTAVFGAKPGSEIYLKRRSHNNSSSHQQGTSNGMLHSIYGSALHSSSSAASSSTPSTIYALNAASRSSNTAHSALLGTPQFKFAHSAAPGTSPGLSEIGAELYSLDSAYDDPSEWDFPTYVQKLVTWLRMWDVQFAPRFFDVVCEYVGKCTNKDLVANHTNLATTFLVYRTLLDDIAWPSKPDDVLEQTAPLLILLTELVTVVELEHSGDLLSDSYTTFALEKPLALERSRYHESLELSETLASFSRFVLSASSSHSFWALVALLHSNDRNVFSQAVRAFWLLRFHTLVLIEGAKFEWIPLKYWRPKNIPFTSVVDHLLDCLNKGDEIAPDETNVLGLALQLGRSDLKLISGSSTQLLRLFVALFAWYHIRIGTLDAATNATKSVCQSFASLLLHLQQKNGLLSARGSANESNSTLNSSDTLSSSVYQANLKSPGRSNTRNSSSSPYSKLPPIAEGKKGTKKDRSKKPKSSPSDIPNDAETDHQKAEKHHKHRKDTYSSLKNSANPTSTVQLLASLQVAFEKYTSRPTHSRLSEVVACMSGLFIPAESDLLADTLCKKLRSRPSQASAVLVLARSFLEVSNPTDTSRSFPKIIATAFELSMDSRYSGIFFELQKLVDVSPLVASTTTDPSKDHLSYDAIEEEVVLEPLEPSTPLKRSSTKSRPMVPPIALGGSGTDLTALTTTSNINNPPRSANTKDAGRDNLMLNTTSPIITPTKMPRTPRSGSTGTKVTGTADSRTSSNASATAAAAAFASAAVSNQASPVPSSATMRSASDIQPRSSPALAQKTPKNSASTPQVHNGSTSTNSSLNSNLGVARNNSPPKRALGTHLDAVRPSSSYSSPAITSIVQVATPSQVIASKRHHSQILCDLSIAEALAAAAAAEKSNSLSDSESETAKEPMYCLASHMLELVIDALEGDATGLRTTFRSRANSVAAPSSSGVASVATVSRATTPNPPSSLELDRISSSPVAASPLSPTRASSSSPPPAAYIPIPVVYNDDDAATENEVAQYMAKHKKRALIRKTAVNNRPILDTIVSDGSWSSARESTNTVPVIATSSGSGALGQSEDSTEANTDPNEVGSSNAVNIASDGVPVSTYLSIELPFSSTYQPRADSTLLLGANSNSNSSENLSASGTLLLPPNVYKLVRFEQSARLELDQLGLLRLYNDHAAGGGSHSRLASSVREIALSALRDVVPQISCLFGHLSSILSFLVNREEITEATKSLLISERSLSGGIFAIASVTSPCVYLVCIPPLPQASAPSQPQTPHSPRVEPRPIDNLAELVRRKAYKLMLELGRTYFFFATETQVVLAKESLQNARMAIDARSSSSISDGANGNSITAVSTPSPSSVDSIGADTSNIGKANMMSNGLSMSDTARRSSLDSHVDNNSAALLAHLASHAHLPHVPPSARSSTMATSMSISHTTTLTNSVGNGLANFSKPSEPPFVTSAFHLPLPRRTQYLAVPPLLSCGAIHMLLVPEKIQQNTKLDMSKLIFGPDSFENHAPNTASNASGSISGSKNSGKASKSATDLNRAALSPSGAPMSASSAQSSTTNEARPTNASLAGLINSWIAKGGRIKLFPDFVNDPQQMIDFFRRYSNEVHLEMTKVETALAEELKAVEMDARASIAAMIEYYLKVVAPIEYRIIYQFTSPGSSDAFDEVREAQIKFFASQLEESCEASVLTEARRKYYEVLWMINNKERKAVAKGKPRLSSTQKNQYIEKTLLNARAYKRSLSKISDKAPMTLFVNENLNNEHLPVVTPEIQTAVHANYAAVLQNAETVFASNYRDSFVSWAKQHYEIDARQRLLDLLTPAYEALINANAPLSDQRKSWNSNGDANESNKRYSGGTAGVENYSSNSQIGNAQHSPKALVLTIYRFMPFVSATSTTSAAERNSTGAKSPSSSSKRSPSASRKSGASSSHTSTATPTHRKTKTEDRKSRNFAKSQLPSSQSFELTFVEEKIEGSPRLLYSSHYIVIGGDGAKESSNTGAKLVEARAKPLWLFMGAEQLLQVVTLKDGSVLSFVYNKTSDETIVYVCHAKDLKSTSLRKSEASRFPGRASIIAFSPRQKLLAVVIDNHVRVMNVDWDGAVWSLVFEFQLDLPIVDVRFAGSSRLVAFTSNGHQTYFQVFFMELVSAVKSQNGIKNSTFTRGPRVRLPHSPGRLLTPNGQYLILLDDMLSASVHDLNHWLKPPRLAQTTSPTSDSVSSASTDNASPTSLNSTSRQQLTSAGEIPHTPKVSESETQIETLSAPIATLLLAPKFRNFVLPSKISLLTVSGQLYLVGLTDDLVQFLALENLPGMSTPFRSLSYNPGPVVNVWSKALDVNTVSSGLGYPTARGRNAGLEVKNETLDVTIAAFLDLLADVSTLHTNLGSYANALLHFVVHGTDAEGMQRLNCKRVFKTIVSAHARTPRDLNWFVSSQSALETIKAPLVFKWTHKALPPTSDLQKWLSYLIGALPPQIVSIEADGTFKLSCLDDTVLAMIIGASEAKNGEKREIRENRSTSIRRSKDGDKTDMKSSLGLKPTGANESVARMDRSGEASKTGLKLDTNSLKLDQKMLKLDARFKSEILATSAIGGIHALLNDWRGPIKVIATLGTESRHYSTEKAFNLGMPLNSSSPTSSTLNICEPQPPGVYLSAFVPHGSTCMHLVVDAVLPLDAFEWSFAEKQVLLFQTAVSSTLLWHTQFVDSGSSLMNPLFDALDAVADLTPSLKSNFVDATGDSLYDATTSLFHGKLCILLSGIVASVQATSAVTEFKETYRKVKKSKKRGADLSTRLFGSQLPSLSLYSDNTSPSYNSSIETIRGQVEASAPKSESGDRFAIHLCALLDKIAAMTSKPIPNARRGSKAGHAEQSLSPGENNLKMGENNPKIDENNPSESKNNSDDSSQIPAQVSAIAKSEMPPIDMLLSNLEYAVQHGVENDGHRLSVGFGSEMRLIADPVVEIGSLKLFDSGFDMYSKEAVDLVVGALKAASVPKLELHYELAGLLEYLVNRRLSRVATWMDEQLALMDAKTALEDKNRTPINSARKRSDSVSKDDIGRSVDEDSSNAAGNKENSGDTTLRRDERSVELESLSSSAHDDDAGQQSLQEASESGLTLKRSADEDAHADPKLEILTQNFEMLKEQLQSRWEICNVKCGDCSLMCAIPRYFHPKIESTNAMEGSSSSNEINSAVSGSIANASDPNDDSNNQSRTMQQNSETVSPTSSTKLPVNSKRMSDRKKIDLRAASEAGVVGASQRYHEKCLKHDCETDHACGEPCHKCGKNCRFGFGHGTDEDDHNVMHECAEKHPCRMACQYTAFKLRGCAGKCTHDEGHLSVGKTGTPHDCGKDHMCNQYCAFCDQYCKHLFNEKHRTHACAETQCKHSCQIHRLCSRPCTLGHQHTEKHFCGVNDGTFSISSALPSSPPKAPAKKK